MTVGGTAAAGAKVSRPERPAGSAVAHASALADPAAAERRAVADTPSAAAVQSRVTGPQTRRAGEYPGETAPEETRETAR